MPATRSPRIPSYRLHKPSGLAVVRLNGRDFYLGRHGSPESQNKYEQLVAEWLTNHQQIRDSDDSDPRPDLTLYELFLAYWRHAESYYRKGGKPTSEQGLIKLAVRPLVELYGRTPVSAIGPLALKTVRQRMVENDISLNVVNKYVSIIKRMFKWGSENELLAPSVYHGLQSVSSLRPGRSMARETEAVTPVPTADIDAVLPFLSPQLQAMIQLQLLTGMRPGEATQIRTCDLDMTGRMWVYTPKSHKTQHRGRERVIYIGPRAQAVIKPFLREDLTACLFSPSEAKIERARLRRANRKSPMTPSQCKRESKRNGRKYLKDHYDKDAYHHAIRRACDRAGVPRWSPNQLRHNAATRLRKEFGLEAARTVLGHRTPVVTEIYAEIDQSKAADIMRRIG